MRLNSHTYTLPTTKQVLTIAHNYSGPSPVERRRGCLFSNEQFYTTKARIQNEMTI